MKISGFFAALLLVAATAPMHADTFDLFFDENGNGLYTETSGSPTANSYTDASGALLFTTPLDTIGGTGNNILIYKLPDFVLNGPVDIGESAGPGISDVLWFTNEADLAAAGAHTYVYGTPGTTDGAGDFGTPNADLMIFFSGDSTGALADSGLPNTVNVGALADATNELADGSFIWLPGGNRYFGQSDEAPEPGSMSLLAVGAGLVGLGAWSRKARR